MGLLDGLEKLINEHGSAAILKERIALFNEQHARVQQLVITLQEQISILNRENERLKLDNSQLQKQIEDYENTLAHKSNPRGYVCDHCGSPLLKRIGSRPDPMFFQVGIKQAIFSCNSCGKESFFTEDP